MPARHFSRRYSLFFACLFLGGGVQLPFLPLWLAHKGLDAPAIGLVIAAQIAVRAIGAPLGALIADLLGARRKVMVLAAALGSGFNIALSFADGFPAILTLAILMAVFLAPVAPLGEAAAVDGSARHDVDYGRIRLWGSLSFVAGGLASGAALQLVPIGWAVPFIAFGNGILALACMSLPADEAKEDRSSRDGSASWTLFLSAPFVAFLAATSLGQASHALLYGFGALNWDHAGYQKATIASFWSLSIAAEVLLFAFSKRVADRMGAIGLIALGTGIGIVRWPLTAFDLPMAAIFLVQLLHALTFAALHLGAMVYIQNTIPKALRNTAQGLYFAITSGIAMSLAIWASGPLFAAYGAHAYLAMAVMSALAFGCALLLRRISPTAPAAVDT